MAAEPSTLETNIVIPNITRRAALTLLAAAAAPAFAQTHWPQKPIRFILPFSAGGPGDITTRLLAQALGKQLKQTVIVENKPGAGGLIGSAYVAKSAPDGYTLLIAGNGMVSNALLRAKMPYAPGDLVPVVSTNTAPSVLVVRSGIAAKNLKELQAYARSQPGGITFGTAGTGSTGHFVAEMVKTSLDVPVTLVHYKSGAEDVAASLGGQIDVVSEAAVGILTYARAGRVVVLAVTGDKRLPLLPDTATTAEQGFPGIRMHHWGGIFAPRDTPTSVMDRISAAMLTALKTDQTLRAQLEANGYYTTVSGGRAEFEQFLLAERQRLGKIVKDSQMTLD